MGQIHEFRRSEESRQEIIAGLDDYRRIKDESERAERERRIRAMADRHIPEWDETWGGPRPFGMTKDQQDKETDEARRKLGLKEQAPPPWYKRARRFYAENWEYMFEGVGPALIVIAMVSMGLLIFVNLGRATGWWGGAW